MRLLVGEFKVSFNFTYLLEIVKQGLLAAIFDKTSSGEAERKYSQKLKFIYLWQDTCEKLIHEHFFLKVMPLVGLSL